MAVLTGSNTADPRARQLLPPVCASSLRLPRLPSVQWMPCARATVRLAGVVLGAIGLALGLGVVWTQLARALPRRAAPSPAGRATC